MSWFKRKPKLKEPPKHLPHHRTSAVTERLLRETKVATAPANKISEKTNK